jgi:hypothetical protein
MLKKLTHLLMALTVVVGIGAAASVQPAEAHRRGGGLVAGAIIGGVVAGALIAGASRRSYASGHCYAGPRRCEWSGRHCFYNRWGDYVCRGGDYRCWRPTICD